MVIAVFILLALMSVISWAIILWKAYVLYSERRALIQFSKQDKAASASQDYVQGKSWFAVNAIAHRAYQLKSLMANKEATDYKDTMSMHLFHVLDEVKISFDKGLPILASIGSAATFVGLFGTVWGIHDTLVEISLANSANLQIIAAPMGEALIATAAGIAVAVPAIIAYNAFSRASFTLIQKLRHVVERLVVYT